MVGEYKNLIRWAGGKRWFLTDFKMLISGLEFNDYYEPFMGGGCVFFSLPEGHKAYLSDLNKDLMIMYEAVRDFPYQVIEKIKSLPVGKEGYYRIRKQKPVNDIDIAARFIYLNHYSFNGIYRENSKGEYNVPYGYNRKEYDYEKILFASKKLMNADISSGDFEKIKGKIKKGDLVFLDPPYSVSEKPKENGFVAYNAHTFSIKDQERLKTLILSIIKEEAYFIMTNGMSDEITSIFNECGTQIITERKCVISGTVNARKSFNECVYSNLPQG